MSTPSKAPDTDHTGITQPLDELIRAVKALSSEKQPAAHAKAAAALSVIRTATHQEAATVVVTPDAPPPSPELTREAFLESVSTQHDTGYRAWKSTFQLPAKYLQTLAAKDTVMAWAKTVPQVTIQAICKYGLPSLKLLTEMPVLDLMVALNQHPTIPGQTESRIWWPEGWNRVAAEPGEFGLTPDTEDMPQEDIYRGRKNPAIVAEYKRRFEQTPLTTIMPQHAYLPSAMDEMAQGKVYDRKNWTGFEQPNGADDVPRAFWYDDRVDLAGADPGGSDGSLRGRLWVRGEKKN